MTYSSIPFPDEFTKADGILLEPFIVFMQHPPVGFTLAVVEKGHCTERRKNFSQAGMMASLRGDPYSVRIRMRRLLPYHQHNLVINVQGMAAEHRFYGYRQGMQVIEDKIKRDVI